MPTLHRQQWIPYPRDRVFEFFSRPENLERITPPFLHFRILTPPPIVMRPGAEILYSLRVRGVPLKWLTIIDEWNPPHHFVDTQAKGPYKMWHHTHRFLELNGGTQIEDTVQFELPFGWLGRLVYRLQVRADVEKIFDYRTKIIPTLLG